MVGPAALQFSQFLRITLCTKNLMAEFRETTSRCKPHVTGTDD